MRIISLNIKHGGGSRATGIANYLVNQRADVIALQEYRLGHVGNLLRNLLMEEGYVHWLVAEAIGGINSAALLSHHPVQAVKVPCPVPVGRRVAIGDVDGVKVASTYWPNASTGRKTRGEDSKSVMFDWIEQVHELREAIIVGDFNNAPASEDVESGAWKRWDSSGRMAAFCERYRDAWREANGPGIREWSHIHNSGKGCRTDHALLPAGISLKACWYDHSTRETGLTDHSALILEIDQPARPLTKDGP